jgi:hypothetical protein
MGCESLQEGSDAANEKVELSDFYHPFFRPVQNVRFEDCDLFGPCLAFVDGCNLSFCEFHDCEYIIARTDRPVLGATRFVNCTFYRCRLYRVTFILNYEAYKSLPYALKAHLPVISDGRIGDV